MAITITEMTDAGNDVLLVKGTDGRTVEVRTGTDDDGTPIVEQQPVTFTATGWVSATTNHFDADDYLPDGHRKPLPPATGIPKGKESDYATPRQMTSDERVAYATALLTAQNAELRPAPTSLLGTNE